MDKSVCTLVATMGKKNYEIKKLIEDMNLQGKVVICNQVSNEGFEKIEGHNFDARIFYSETRGLSYSRNLSLLNSDSDYCIIADDDMSYKENYELKILEEFKRTQADVIIFSLPKDLNKDHNDIRVNYLNYKKYGSVRIAFRRDAIVTKEIFFPISFGSGSKYSSGEDTIFIQQCLKSGLKVIKVSSCIIDYLDTNTANSTWFEGFNNKFYFDKGALYSRLSKHFSTLTSAIFAMRKSKNKDSITFVEALKEMRSGAKAYSNNEMTFNEFYGRRERDTND